MTTQEIQNYRKISINVLGYKENDEWVALALEMDLRGYGDTFDDAIADLNDLIAMQIGFSRGMESPEMAFFPAEAVWFQLFADVRREALRDGVRLTPHSAREREYEVAGLPMPDAHMIAQFQKNDTACEGHG